MSDADSNLVNPRINYIYRKRVREINRGLLIRAFSFSVHPADFTLSPKVLDSRFRGNDG